MHLLLLSLTLTCNWYMHIDARKVVDIIGNGNIILHAFASVPDSRIIDSSAVDCDSNFPYSNSQTQTAQIPIS